MSISPTREAILQKTVDALLTARRTMEPLEQLPADLQPQTEVEAFYVQDEIARAFGPVGGWKISAHGPGHEPFFAPMPAAWIAADGALFRGHNHRLHGVEAEIAFQFTRDLPFRAAPYTREEIAACVTCHPAIEVLESVFIDPAQVPRASMLADLQMHGGFVPGPSIANWQNIDWAAEKVTLLTDAVVRVENTGTSPSGNDLIRLLVYLANEGATRTGGLAKGTWVTTGSWTGATWAIGGSQVLVRFAGAGSVSLQFAPDTC